MSFLSCSSIPRLTKTNPQDNVSYIDKVFGMSREFILTLAQVSPSGRARPKPC